MTNADISSEFQALLGNIAVIYDMYYEGRLGVVAFNEVQQAWIRLATDIRDLLNKTREINK